MQKRPKIKLKLTLSDQLYEVAGWFFLFAIWGLIIFNYSALPDTIPIHYNASGQADNFGNKTFILIFPIVSTVLFIGLSILNQYPHSFNYPTKITPENALRQYTLATRVIRHLKLTTMIMFGLLALQIIQNANGGTEGLGVWLLPLIMAMFFIPLVYFLIQLFRSEGGRRQPQKTNE